MEKTILQVTRIVAFVVFILVIMSSNQIYNQKILALKQDQILEAIQTKSFTVRCVPSTINIDQVAQKVITSLDCDRGQYFVNSGFDSGIHVVTGDYKPLLDME